MVTKMQLTKELHDLRQKASDLEDKASEKFKELMVEINALKVKIKNMFGEEDAPK